MDSSMADFVRWIEPEEIHEDLVDEAKEGTYVKRIEFAVVLLEDGRKAMVCGGPGGIKFLDRGEGDEIAVYLSVEDAELRVIELCWHTHPVATGPSDFDFKMLGWLNQPESIIYEIGGERHGTRFRVKSGGDQG